MIEVKSYATLIVPTNKNIVLHVQTIVGHQFIGARSIQVSGYITRTISFPKYCVHCSVNYTSVSEVLNGPTEFEL